MNETDLIMATMCCLMEDENGESMCHYCPMKDASGCKYTLREELLKRIIKTANTDQE